MYEGLKHAHSGLRWLVLLFLVLAVVKAFTSSRKDRVATLAMVLFHLQLVIGLILYFFLSPMTKNLSIDMKDSVQRFYGVEHFMMMVIAAILITVGHSSMKKGKFSRYKYFYLAALLITVLGIPWPFRIAMAGWF